MGSVVIRRLFTLIFTLIGASILTFVISHTIPGDPLAAILGERAMNNPEIVANYKARWGLDRSLPEQYGIYMLNILKGDMGQSISSQRPVLDDLKQYFPATIELALGSLTVTVFGGLVLGVIAALYHARWPDHLVRLIALWGSSMPVFWLALVALQIFYAKTGWFPGPGRLDSSFTPPPTVTGLFVIDGMISGDWGVVKNALYHLVLPSLVLGWYELGLIARTMRSAMLETMTADYVRTARGKGLKEKLVLFRHMMPNAMLPTITVIGLAVGGLMAGAVMTETVFAWPGIGRYAVDASELLDFPAIMGVTLLIATVFVVANLLVDLAYSFLDPRIRTE